ncbi:MAG TPA: hypothetical protein VNJ71_11930 [Gemmatimonadales bacterium]|nr:hypothetical protein [Gemmatimonadales bacterium]
MALAVLMVAGLPVLALGQEGLATVERDRWEERTMARADRLLSALALLGRDELNQRIGRHEMAGFMVAIQRPDPWFYRIAIEDLEFEGVEVLVTVLHRPVDWGSSGPPDPR